MLSPENKKILAKRLKSLAWSIGTMMAPAIVNFVAANLSLFNLPAWAVVGIGLVLAQITKVLNSQN